MRTLPQLIESDSITAAWFWVTSRSIGSYAEEEEFDVTFVRETDYVVGGGYHERRTFHMRGVITHKSHSRRENGGKIVKPKDMPGILAQAIIDAHAAVQYPTFRAWSEDQRDYSRTYRDALNDFDDWETYRARHAQLVVWLGDEYDEYVKAAEEYLADN
jgi:hypothetical protein